MSARTIFSRALLTSSARSLRPTSGFLRPLTNITTTTSAFNTTTTNSPFTNNTRNFSSTMSKEGVHNLSSKAEFDAALGNSGLMVVDFFATWCGPCKVIAPQVVKMSDNYKDTRFFKIDVDEVPEVAQQESVRAMPTFLLYKNGEKVSEVVGANPTALEAAIKQHA
ncbi:hypothetical protein Q7P37_007450 [Cladosporium fusiforme]